MTDHNEKLIEEARRAKTAVYLATDARVADDLSRIIGGLADALEAVEKAHTPTDDEREALARIVQDVLLVNYDAARRIVDEMVATPAWPFHRSEATEPSAEDVSAYLRGDEAHFSKRAEPQGEPSDAQVDAVGVAIAVAANADYWTDEIAEWENAEGWEREAYPDNYPSTAYEDREEFRKQARAALRAAGGVER